MFKLVSLALAGASGVAAARDADLLRIVESMTLSQKLAYFGGYDGNYIGNLPGQTVTLKSGETVEVPPVNMNDGPQGFRSTTISQAGLQGYGMSTAYPCNAAVGATWDRELAYKYGQALATEFKAKGANVILGPGLNVLRAPLNGRTFEYISGEEPVLGAELVGPLVKGAFDMNMTVCLKHYVHNNQEFQRGIVNAELSQAAEMELYLKPFDAGIRAGAGSVMCSYNR